MTSRRSLLLATPALLLARTAWARPGFDAFLDGVRDEAREHGISPAILRAALGGLSPDEEVIRLDHRQPEFTQSWAQYRAARLSPARIDAGRDAGERNRRTLQAVARRFGVWPGILLGIWGLESNYGGYTGNFGTVRALATLGWNRRRGQYFRAELLDALRILQHGDVTPRRMTGSYAGAMGQPQFMPSAYLHYAVDFDGDGRADIWHSRPDVLASMANYLAHFGWKAGTPWGQPISVPPGFNPALAGRDHQRPLEAWMAMGVRRADGSPFARREVPGAVLLPGGPGGEAFMVYANFNVIRRYNPSDFYALAVGLLADQASRGVI